ncbi:Phylloplanin precursor [Dorcoceras hygrometricum]|uniref:Phylloplanin n=1 Tax=Dorcoceras hygrometricum TaxID=472368 RepID=A0A2Z7A959_9LAMI|nr:Phylloplanin precursor [Dorcoceras hygrometricum]
MAVKSILIFLLVAVLATCSADAQRTIGIIHVNGTLYCTTNGNITGGPNASPTPVFANAALQVACEADVVALAPVNGTTNSNGAYLVVMIPLRNATINSIVSNCRLFVLTPLSSCDSALPARGLLSNLRFVKTVFGFLPLTYMAAAGFSLQP